ncbi:sensor histidine kinase [Granulicella cerasi]|uniref:histidine kinase n=1 Tax=Granulicella cerasi TaxID=741063 RepID=A0ABW1ZES9_9BACT|nr:ATP-binding protein [Granulicella cerasi]
MGTNATRRRIAIITLGVCLLLLFLGLATLNAFNLNFLNPASASQTLVFIALSTVAFILFLAVLFALVRNILKLYADQRSRVLGTRLRTRMLWGAVLVSVIPLVFMFAFSYLLMNRALDRWFSQPVTQMRDDANRLAVELFRYAAANARSEADSIGVEISAARTDNTAAINDVFAHHDLTLQGGFAVIYHDNHPIASLHLPTGSSAQIHALQPPDEATDEDPTHLPPVISTTLNAPAPEAILIAARRNDEPFYNVAGTDYTLATAGLKNGNILVVGLPIPNGISATSLRLRSAADAYWTLFRERRVVRNLYMFLLLLITVLALFACCWLALTLAKQVTKPIETLADAMEAIASGDYAHRVDQTATEELGELSASFNAMASDLDNARLIAEQSTQQLSELNIALLARRRELETIIETIPSGLVTLSAERNVVLANRAFYELLDPGGQRSFVALTLDAIFPAEVVETLDRLLRRSHRMGSAAAELEVATTAGTKQLSATIAVIDDGPQHDVRGYVLVLEDATELLRAQKQSAWKEVARRVAHEIKNPLTPIALNAELIRRHIDRLEPLITEASIDTRSPAVIQRSTEVISSSVETMRQLVDQFSALAEFPTARPRPADINSIVENSLALFAGRLGNIRVHKQLARELPLVLADPNALQRALSNLIDNAAEAMQNSLLRELTLSTRPLESGMVELCVADTGSGLTDELRSRLFLPYFSTKQRGTGLGLSIAAKIIQEHQGNIRAEKNVPSGARFIIELRPANETQELPEQRPLISDF